MITAAVDATLIAWPSPDSGSASFYDYVQGIVDLSDLQRAAWVELVITGSTADALSVTDRYPLYETLKRDIERLGLSEVIQVKDVVRVVNTLLTRTTSLEEITGIDDVLADEVVHVPSTHLEGRPPRLVEEYEKLRVLIALARRHGYSEPFEPRLLTPGLQADPCEAYIRAELLDVAPAGIVPSVPVTLEDTIDACSGLKSLCACTDPVRLWQIADSDEVCECALALHLDRIQTGDNPPGSVPKNWRFGREFVGSIQRVGFLPASQSTCCPDPGVRGNSSALRPGCYTRS